MHVIKIGFRFQMGEELQPLWLQDKMFFHCTMEQLVSQDH
jgi:hypothetical protein